MPTTTVRVVNPEGLEVGLAGKADLVGGKVKTSQLPAELTGVAPTIVTIPYAASIKPDASKGNTQRCTLTGNVTVQAPSNPTEGQMLLFEFTSQGGAYQVSLQTGVAGGFQFGTDIAAIPAGTIGRRQVVGVIYHASTSRWDVVTVASGFPA